MKSSGADRKVVVTRSTTFLASNNALRIGDYLMLRSRLIFGLTLSAMTLLTAAVSQAAPPEIIAGTNREAEVIFKGNNCVVYYRRNGTRRRALPVCRARQISRADRSMAAYRREQGWNRGDRRNGRNVGRAVGAIIAIGIAAALAKKNKH